jgi:alpha-tubulin suppressor-like RCC1 family protein
MLSNIISIGAGFAHTCCCSATGSVYCWGGNTYGQLGLLRSSWFPLLLTQPGVLASKVIAGKYHTCVLSIDAFVWCWGLNEYGQLGNGTKENWRSAAAKVLDLKNVLDIAAGDAHTCALQSDQT